MFDIGNIAFGYLFAAVGAISLAGGTVYFRLDLVLLGIGFIAFGIHTATNAGKEAEKSEEVCKGQEKERDKSSRQKKDSILYM